MECAWTTVPNKQPDRKVDLQTKQSSRGPTSKHLLHDQETETRCFRKVHAKVMKMELGLPNEKKIKECIQLDQSIETTLNCYLEEDLFTCVRVLARNIKLD